MVINYEEFRGRLKQERLKYHITYRGMGENVQISHSQYYKGENGHNRISYDELQNICSTKINLFHCFTGKTGICTDAYDDILKNVSCDGLIACLRMINILASQKKNKDYDKEEWEHIYRETEYLNYIYHDDSKEKNVFKAVRKFNGIKQIQMAISLGMDVKTLRNLEAGKKQPDSEIIYKMYQIYNVSPSALLYNKKCFLDELTILLNSYTGQVREMLLYFVKTVTLIM